jgi:hypothetical protein
VVKILFYLKRRKDFSEICSRLSICFNASQKLVVSFEPGEFFERLKFLKINFDISLNSAEKICPFSAD